MLTGLHTGPMNHSSPSHALPSLFSSPPPPPGPRLLDPALRRRPLPGQPTPRRRVAKNFPTPTPTVPPPPAPPPPPLPPHAPHPPRSPLAADRATRRRREPWRRSRPEAQVGRPVTGDIRAPDCALAASRAVDYVVCIMCLTGRRLGNGPGRGSTRPVWRNRPARRPAVCTDRSLMSQ